MKTVIPKWRMSFLKRSIVTLKNYSSINGDLTLFHAPDKTHVYMYSKNGGVFKGILLNIYKIN